LPIFNVLITNIKQLVKNIKTDTLFVDFLGYPTKGANCATLIHTIMKDISNTPTVVTASAHCVRVGTCSALFQLGFDK
jgi:hypothetical protein